MTKQIIIDIEKCNLCPNLNHTGAFTKGGAKPCCEHPETLKLKGMSCFKRVIPYRRIYSKEEHEILHYIEVKKIPKWCPLPDKKKYNNDPYYENRTIPKVPKKERSQLHEGCEATESDILIMKELQTILGADIPIETRGIIYLCEYNYSKLTLTVFNEMLFVSAFDALQAYSNIPNPESQLVDGKTFDELIINLKQLHQDMENKEWLEQLGDCI